MTFAVPEFLCAILKKDCEVVLEPIDVDFISSLIIHIYSPDNINIDIFVIDDSKLRVELWWDCAGNCTAPYFNVFDLNEPESIKSITDFLLEYLSGSLVKIRFQKRDKDANTNKTKSKRSN